MISKPTEYAIRALVYIVLKNKENKRPGYKEIATEVGSPVQYTAKILQDLTRRKIVSSIKGPGGGFFFEEPDAPLPLYDAIYVLEGDNFVKKCGFGLSNCDANNPCPVHDYYVPVRDSYFRLTKNITIQILANKILEEKAVLKRLNPLAS